MNKKIWFLVVTVVALPSIALAGNVDMCTYVYQQLNAQKSVVEISSELEKMNANKEINASGVTNFTDLVAKSLQEKNKGSTDLGVINRCNDVAYDQTNAKAAQDDVVGKVSNRRGQSKGTDLGGGTGGSDEASRAGVSVGAAGGGISMLSLTPDNLGLKGGGSTGGLHEAEGVIGHDHSNTEGNDKEAALTSCNILEFTSMCAVPTTSGNLVDIMNVAANLPKELSHCSCIENKAKSKIGIAVLRDRKVDEKVDQMKNMVIANFSRKFINDYATHLEDMRFFSVTASNVFGKDQQEQVKQAEGMLCSNPADFRAAVEAKCKGKLSDAQANEKMNKLFSLLGEKTSGYDYFARLNGKIMVNSDGEGTKLTRDEFDKARKGISDKDMDFKFADNMVASLMRNDQTREMILRKGVVPQDGILRFVTEQIRKDDKFLLKFLNKDLLGDQVFKEMSIQFKDASVALGVLKDKLEWSKQIHPGFESLMKNRTVFEQTGDKMKKSNKSAIEVLDSDDAIVKPNLVARCAELKSNFAEFMCTDEKDIVKNTPKNELREVVKRTMQSEDELLFNDLAICKSGSDKTEKSAFSELHITPDSRVADILERLSAVPQNEQKNLFTKTMLQGKKGDEATRRYLANAAQDGSSRSSGLASDSFGSKFSVKESEKMSFIDKSLTDGPKSTEVASNFRDDKSTSSQQNSQQNQKEYNDPNAQLNNAYTANYSAAAAPVAPTDNSASKAAANDKTDVRNDLREFLSNKENQENVDRLMKNADDKQLAELQRLREESDRRKEQILQLTTENEKLKLKSMQDELAALEEKRAKAVTSNVGANESDEEPKSSGRGSREIASVSGESTGSSSAGVSGSRGGAATSGSNSVAASEGGTGGKASGLSGLRNELAGLTGNETTSGSSSEAVVISSAKARTGSLEIKSNDLSNEILNFLESEPDVQTLIKMRKSGMIYQYKVLENGKEITKEIAVDYKTLSEDVKKLIDQKIADSGRAGSEAQRLSAEIRNLRRAYTYNSLKVILGEQLKKRQ